MLIYLDSTYVVSKCIMLINEMLSIAQYMYFCDGPRTPSLDTIENLTKLSPMIVQGLWPKNSTLLQLPHITEHHLHYLRKVTLHSYYFFFVAIFVNKEHLSDLE